MTEVIELSVLSIYGSRYRHIHLSSSHSVVCLSLSVAICQSTQSPCHSLNSHLLSVQVSLFQPLCQSSPMCLSVSIPVVMLVFLRLSPWSPFSQKWPFSARESKGCCIMQVNDDVTMLSHLKTRWSLSINCWDIENQNNHSSSVDLKPTQMIIKVNSVWPSHCMLYMVPLFYLHFVHILSARFSVLRKTSRKHYTMENNYPPVVDSKLL